MLCGASDKNSMGKWEQVTTFHCPWGRVAAAVRVAAARRERGLAAAVDTAGTPPAVAQTSLLHLHTDSGDVA